MCVCVCVCLYVCVCLCTCLFENPCVSVNKTLFMHSEYTFMNKFPK